jgi:thymine-DNA glycosylase
MASETGLNGDAVPSEPATFKGQLKMTDFVFKKGGSEPDPLVRRSPRLSTPIRSTPSSSSPATAAPAPSRTSSASTKRKSSTKDDSQLSSLSTKKRQRQPAGYAPPSTYAHLPLLPDAIAQNLLVLFVGLNPGIQTARSGHAYAHPSNLFWKLLYSSGVTPRPCKPEEDGAMPALFSLGLTNIVARPSRNGAELSKQEMDAGVAILEAKAREFRPESMCVVGKSIWESIWRVRHGKAIGKSEFKYGWQDERENMGVIKKDGDGKAGWAGARVFVATSTSGLAASLSTAEKETIWRQLGAWVEKRRSERKAAEETSAN